MRKPGAEAKGAMLRWISNRRLEIADRDRGESRGESSQRRTARRRPHLIIHTSEIINPDAGGQRAERHHAPLDFRSQI